jgi:Leucyl aminopeptidase (aminopeptidase T)
MRTVFASVFRVAVFTGLLVSISANAQDDKGSQQLAMKLVQSGSVKTGDVVVVEGGKHMVPLMEAVAIEVQKAGGMAVMFLDSDRVTRSFYTEVPEKYLEQEPRFLGEWLKHANVYIGLPATEDRKGLIDGVPETRFAKLAKANDFFAGLLSSLPIRVVNIDFPTKQDAEINGLEFPAYQKLVIDGVNADYHSISAQSNKVQLALQNAKQIKVTSPAGTDITFSLAPGREIYVDDGIVTEEETRSKVFAQRIAALPGGNVFFAPLETSSNGQVVVPKMQCRFAPMNDVSFEFKDGMLQNFKAGTNGECFQQTMKPYSGSTGRFGAVWIGTNPSLRIVEEGNANFRPFNAAGMVYLGIGENRIYGGNNSTNLNYQFPITNATVEVDGKAIIKNGKLLL